LAAVASYKKGSDFSQDTYYANMNSGYEYDYDFQSVITEMGKFVGPNVTIWGVTGHKGDGKSTFVRNLAWRYKNIWPAAFANPLKKSCIALFGIEPKYLYDQDYKNTIIPNWGVTGRDLMQKYGVCIRNFSKEFNESQIPPDALFIKRQMIEMGKSSLSEKLVLIEDVRFPNEADVIHGLGGKIIRVIDVDKDIKRKENETDNDKHESESYFDLIKSDYTIINDHTKGIKHMNKQINPFCETMLQSKFKFAAIPSTSSLAGEFFGNLLLILVMSIFTYYSAFKWDLFPFNTIPTAIEHGRYMWWLTIHALEKLIH
jgi:hypothetical protein